MRQRSNKKWYIFYPEDSGKNIWDIFMTIILIFSCILIPLKLAIDSEFDDH